MCLIAIAIGQDEQYPLIFLSNRDEFYQRPATDMYWWEGSDILAGKDLQAGGTWLGINSKKQFAAVTNYRDLLRNNPKAPSRGAIPTDILNDQPENFNDYVMDHQAHWNSMNGFNLIYHNGEATFHYSNISKEITELKNGIYAVSNALLDTPWPKVVHIKAELRQAITNQKIITEDLLSLLSNDHKFPDDQLPDTGVGLEWERMLSPICIKSPVYGTRTHTIILKDISQKMIINETQTISGKSSQYII